MAHIKHSGSAAFTDLDLLIVLAGPTHQQTRIPGLPVINISYSSSLISGKQGRCVDLKTTTQGTK